MRSEFGLKSLLTQSAIRTVTARYDTVRTQMKKKPILFSRPQADLVRNRDYSFVTDKKSGTDYLSLNTLDGRIIVTFDVPECFKMV